MNGPLTRRQLLRRGAAAGGALVGLPAILAACGGGIEGTTAEGGAATTAGTAAGATTAAKELADKLVFSNWPLYIDVDEATGSYPTLEQFTEETGVEVEYIEDINDNNEFFGKIQGPLSRGQSIDRDLIVLTDTSGIPARMIELGYLEPLDKSAIPNIVNLVDALKSPGWDPNRDYSLPWQSGMTGIGYDLERVGGELTSVEQLLTDPKLKGKVTLLTELPDTIGLVMLANGDDPTAVTEEAFQRAIDTIQQALDAGQIRQFTGNDYAPLLARGDVWAAFAWSGDMVQLQADNPNLTWALPESGGMIWTDNMLIPKGGDAYTASTFMNFVYDPKIAAQIAAYVNYISPVKGAGDILRETDPEIANNTLIFPTEEMLANVRIFDAQAVNNQDYRERFQALLGA
jgi:spermidine/putrescine transport system substrate-binding protein